MLNIKCLKCSRTPLAVTWEKRHTRHVYSSRHEEARRETVSRNFLVIKYLKTKNAVLIVDCEEPHWSADAYLVSNVFSREKATPKRRAQLKPIP